MSVLKLIWGCANEIQQVLCLVSVPYIHPTQTNEGSLIMRRQTCIFLGQSELLLLLMHILFDFEM